MSDESMNNFTPRAQQVLALARKEADRFNHSFVGTEHLLLGLINLGQGVAVNVLQKMGLDLETVRLEVEKQVGTGPDQKLAGNIPYTPRVKKVLELSKKEAKALHHTYVGTEHILLGLLREGEGVAARVLRNLDIDIDQCRQEILHELDPNFEGDDEVASGIEEESEGGKKQVKTPALKAFGRDLTEIAKKGEMDPVIGRSEEIERVMEALKESGCWTRGYVSMVFGCPYEGAVSMNRTSQLATALMDAGADIVVLGDTIGMAHPDLVRETIAYVANAGIPLARTALHRPDTRGTAVANVVAGLEAGIRTFDGSIAGVGGCPYAPGAAGNAATEDLIAVLEAMGWSTGIDLDLASQTGAFLADALGRDLPGRMHQVYLANLENAESCSA